ncbi:hypothetical protein FSOLCH5_013207 [Fusarium solani]
MQELVRRYFDEVLDREDESSQFEKLFIYTVSKDEFYAEYAQKETAENWLNTHPFQNAVSDDADSVWIGK